MTLDCLALGHHTLEIFRDGFSRISNFDRLMDGYGLDDDSRPFRQNLRNMSIRIDGEWMVPLRGLSHFKNKQAGRDVGQYTFWETPSSAVLYLMSYLAKRGFTVKGAGFFSGQADEIARILTTESPRTVAITTTYYTDATSAQQVARFVRALAPDTKIVIGGPMMWDVARKLSTAPDRLRRLLEVIGADVYVRESEGEKTLAGVISALRSGADLSQVPNVYVRQNGGFRFTFQEIEDNNVEESLIDYEVVRDVLAPNIWMRTAKSCAYKCTFCDFPQRMGNLAWQSVETVEAQLAGAVKAGVKHINFVDDTFNIPAKRFEEILEMMAKNRFPLTWTAPIRCGHIRKDSVFDLMRDTGCIGAFLGIESASNKILETMKKVAEVDRYRHGIGELNRRGIATQASFVVGFPGETWETIEETLRFINETEPTLFTPAPWWYDEIQPISQRAAELGIEGHGYRWRHHTMDSVQAFDAVEYLFANAKTSIPGFNSWGAFCYLRGVGVSFEETTRILRAANTVREVNAIAGGSPFAIESRQRALTELDRCASEVAIPEPRTRYEAPRAFDDRQYWQDCANAEAEIRRLMSGQPDRPEQIRSAAG